MTEKSTAYLVNIGMVTPVGANSQMTVAIVKAGISQYGITDYYTHNDDPATMCLVPDEFFDTVTLEIDEGNHYGAQHDRVIKMAVVALRETLSNTHFEKAIPLILAFPEPLPNTEYSFPETLKTNLLAQKDLPLQKEMLYSLYTGRAGGIQSINIALHYLYDLHHDYVLVGASDSYFQCPRLSLLDESDRLLSRSNNDGFAPGEAACFLLLTRHKQFAEEIDGHVIALHEPGTGEEPGHFYSEKPYLGEGLDVAFKQVLSSYGGEPIETVYSSMNGERYWSKENGVAMVRNERYFHSEVNIEHPADCFGDLGAATGLVSIGLAASGLSQKPSLTTSLVYSASDGVDRAALRIEKTPLGSNVKRSQS